MSRQGRKEHIACRLRRRLDRFGNCLVLGAEGPKAFRQQCDRFFTSSGQREKNTLPDHDYA